jgi:hypothetical protein
MLRGGADAAICRTSRDGLASELPTPVVSGTRFSFLISLPLLFERQLHFGFDK